ncbi:DUF262 domain-containing protein [Streptomyces adustus]|uniref:DUF262 domain-containing protein n=1 Tax=Streptomyces adustus TaxID=1609272 RepID=A0A5N8VHE2_9ACTN|nr:DUF262 domain-containing protein [Streptomyces adustus]MPY33405.1 DUF262 domain-containing protein [Streptomyces adustus]
MAFGAASVSPRSVGMGALLEEHHPFWVPVYQRAYAWDEQTAAFIDDVKDLLEESNSQRGHFFGGFVCIEHTDHSQSRPHRYQIVDGQQRLTTFVLTLSEISAAAQEISDKARRAGDDRAANSANILCEDMRNRFIYWNHSNVTEGRMEKRPRLSLSTADDKVFQDLLEGRDVVASRESHELLLAAQKALQTNLIKPIVEAADSWKDKVASLDRLRHALTVQSHVIQIVCLDRERAYQLFSVLNDRGRSLEDADLLRSYTLELLEGKPHEQRVAAQTWDEILSTPAAKVSAFLKAYYPSTTGTRAGTPLFQKLCDAYFPKQPPLSPAEVSQQISRFSKEKETYLKIAAGEWPFEDSVVPGFTPEASAWQKDRLGRLVRTLKHELALPLLLAAAQCTTEKKFAELVFMLEIFAFRYKNVCGGHASPAQTIYYAEAKRVREAAARGEEVKWNELRTKLQQLLDKSAPDEHFKVSLDNHLRYDRGSAQKANLREFLTTLEDHRGWLDQGALGRPKPDMMAVFDLQQVTIEHIYPQNPLPGEPQTDMAELLNRLGNLTFFGPRENSDAGNKTFTSKCVQHYAHSKVRMTRDLTELPQWTKTEYDQRLKNLQADACKVFRLLGTNTTTP